MKLHGSVLVCLVACGGGDDGAEDTLPPIGTQTGDPPSGECDDDEDCRSGEVCDDGTCVTGDGDDTQADARPIAMSSAPEETGAIDPAGDIDWWVYTASVPGWVDVRTTSEGGLDTVLRVWRADGTEYAAIDNYATGLAADYDSLLRVYLDTSGEWYFTVEDVTTYYTTLFDPDDHAGGADYEYTLWVQEYDNLLAESDGIDDPSAAIVLDDGGTIFSLGFVIDEPGDSDWLTAEVTAGTEPLEIWAQPANYGSSLDLRVRLYDAAGTLLADRADVGPDGWLSYFDPAPGETYTVEVTDVSGDGAADAWGVVYARTYDPGGYHPFFAENVYDHEVEPNDSVAGATPVAMASEGDASFPYDAGRVEGDLALVGDTDVYVAAVDRAFVTVRCFGEAFGSLAVLSVRVADPTGTDVTPVGQGDVPVGDWFVYNVPAGPAGDWAISVTSLDGSAGLQTYYRCAVYASEEELLVE